MPTPPVPGAHHSLQESAVQAIVYRGPPCRVSLNRTEPVTSSRSLVVLVTEPIEFLVPERSGPDDATVWFLECDQELIELELGRLAVTTLSVLQTITISNVRSGRHM